MYQEYTGHQDIREEKNYLKNPQARLNKSVKGIDKIKLIFLLKLLYITLPT